MVGTNSSGGEPERSLIALGKFVRLNYCDKRALPLKGVTRSFAHFHRAIAALVVASLDSSHGPNQVTVSSAIP